MHVRSSDAASLRTVTELPHLNMATDPLSDLARAEERFHSYQVGSGLEILRNGQHVETAADAQNVAAAKDELQRQSVPDMTPAPPLMKPYEQQRYVEPYNDPFSTVPGGLGFNPMKPPGWFPPGA